MKPISQIKSGCYYFYIKPFVYAKCNQSRCFLFNTLNKKYLIVDDNIIVPFLIKLLKLENFRIFDCSTLLKNIEFINFYNSIKELEMGDILLLPISANKPIQIPPEIIVEHDISLFTKKSVELMDDIKQYVHTISFFINNGKFVNANNIYINSFKQFNSPTFDPENYIELSFKKIKFFFDTLDILPDKVIISGGNIFSYSQFDNLITYLNDLETLIIYQIDINDFVLNSQKLKSFNNINSFFQIFVTANNQSLCSLEQLIDFSNISIHFILSNESDYKLMDENIKNNNIPQFLFIPYLSNNNWKFFKKNVFFNFNDIIMQNETIKKIQSKTKFNSNLFGNIYIQSTGEVYLHQTQTPIGNIDDNIYGLIFNEFVSHKRNAWFLTRNDVEPCKNCIFVLMCPPISGYELFSKKFNLCNIKTYEK